MKGKSRPGKESRQNLSAMVSLFLLACLGLAVPYLAAKDKSDKKNKGKSASAALKNLPTQELTEDEAVLHALNRLGFGPEPGEVESVKQMGLQKWIDQQLHPESIDDSTLDARLAQFPTLHMTSTKLLNDFPQPKAAAKKEGVTVQEYRQEQQARNRAATQDANGAGDGADRNAPAADSAQNNNSATDPIGTDLEKLASTPPQAGANNAPINYANVRTPARVVAELSMAKVTRAVYSERQLYEQMVDFWYNHFNVYAGKGVDRWLITSYERDAIRPYAMGRFRDLLEATAKSPAMLFYLDNWLSADPVAVAEMRQEQQQRQLLRQYRRFGPLGGVMPLPPQNAKQQERGLNENYGRELMELHTLGVDGGYTQQDVIEVARAFTGWTMREPRRDPEFFFDDRIHDKSPKIVLGHKINAGGMKDGEEVLDLLARDPHTAHHISFELAQRFVSDNPPPALVDRMSQTFLASDGDIREVLRTMIDSPEFWSKDAYRAKIKTPFEVVVSAARAVGADLTAPLPLVQWSNRIGEPLYQCQPPTGYSDKADAWVNTGALLNRLNYSLALANNRLRGAQVNVAALLGTGALADPHEALNQTIDLLLGGLASDQTRATLEQELKDPRILQASLDDPVKQVNAGIVAGLVLGSPEFQRR